jgi:hypothetical protein
VEPHLTSRRLAIALAVLLATRGGAAQAIIGADLGIETDLVWRGLTRSNPTSIQPAVVVGYQTRATMVTAGVWASLEPFAPDVDELSNVGAGGEVLGEADVWVQLDHRIQKLVTFDLALGWTAYTFHGRTGLGGRGSEWDTSELYLKAKLSKTGPLLPLLALPRRLPLALEGSVWKDLGPIGGVYGEVALEVDLPVIPLGEPLGALLLRGALGMSGGQRNVPPTEAGYYERSGPTHVELSASTAITAPLGPAQLTVYPVAHLQIGLDEATLRRGLAAGDRSRVFCYWGATFSVLYPVRREP